MRYTDNTASLSTIEAPPQPSFISLNPLPIPPPTGYTDGGAHGYFPTAPTVYSTSLDVRPRLGSNSTSASGMAHAPRSNALPHPGSQLSIRDSYATTTPTFRRQDHHIPRSPSFGGITSRRHPLSPTPSPATYNTHRMDGTYGSKTQPNIPPLTSIVECGVLSYGGPQATPIKVEISGIIDKGFFLAEEQWTCYRRNYFSCVCSFSLTPNLPTTEIQFVQTGSPQPYTVYGFAMSISAAVADSDNQTIELVQHTPKRDKGPVAKPEKVRLLPKPAQQTHHPLSGLYSNPDGSLSSSRAYDHQPYGQQQSPLPTEHTFERIQFKQATANNGKRRAAQQYYHLIVELWADVGSQGGAENYIKVAYRKSAKMIVRGRSPGHYQNERRGSTSSGPGGSGAGSIGGGYSSVLGPGGDYHPGTMLPGGFTQFGDPRGGYGARHHHELTMEPMMSHDEAKSMTDHKGYQYFPATIYESEHADPRHQQVELFSHSRTETESNTVPSMSSGYDPTKVKPEGENGLPSMFYPPVSSYYSQQRCGRFEGKNSSSGYYPTSIPPSSTMNMT
ncbi:hypothetical protein GE21DRAFT_6602 [Neurospora crassa]|uniref:Female sexual development-1 protein, variant 1 n=1 Tax=Neurospora crassa (strain ATCC 24698 / 74-OR23-1A / CBS 708.71 / DSM 1257 / FGSC 987) TaxID=367110 RepID=V5IN09_NEUCR|nr:female sexual development-1 protein, variant 1 [Neurospora crassa OR74A]ESA43062.1 female sexual development-1 protein, variant 1 [Neurospora crassa OR74A]KHE84915.1 hypothetical protein GE21DRAFT_6602 [Neurospora crassa]|eukprot:XP_011394329.1 female sexual development-1 protein, variant 1 [Neurospora crassa OR74A]